MVNDNLLETDRKRYADDVTVQELVRLRVENDKQREGIERLREALRLERQLRDSALSLANDLQNELNRMNGHTWSVAAALQQKESK